MKFILCRRCFTVKNPNGQKSAKTDQAKNPQDIGSSLAAKMAHGCQERDRGFSLHTSSRPSVNTSEKVGSDAQLYKFTVTHIPQYM